MRTLREPPKKRARFLFAACWLFSAFLHYFINSIMANFPYPYFAECWQAKSSLSPFPYEIDMEKEKVKPSPGTIFRMYDRFPEKRKLYEPLLTESGCGIDYFEPQRKKRARKIWSEQDKENDAQRRSERSD